MRLDQLTEPAEFSDLFYDYLTEGAKKTWARTGNRVVKKYRCTNGPRAGRVVNTPSACYGAIDIRKRALMRRTRTTKGTRMDRKSNKTKRINPASRRVQKLNRKD